MLAVDVPIEVHELGNGLRVILSPRRDLPVGAVTVLYEVGSVDEVEGKTGFAHLFEHLMFQGSAHVPRNGHFKMVEAAGGSLNAFTMRERTVYFEALPSHQLALGLWLEADRMRSLAITKENFETERSTVKEERRQSYDNRAYGRAYEELEGRAYDDPRYAHSVIGSMADLDRASLDDVREFWQRFYAPANAVLVLTGDIPRDALALVRHYFEDLPARPRSGTRRPGVAAALGREEREDRMEDAHAQSPALFLAVPQPEALTRPWYALRLLRQVLTQGDSSRLHQRLVKKDQAALHVSAYIDTHRGPGNLTLVVMAVPGRLDAARRALSEELQTIAASGITEGELDKARNRVLARTVDGLATSLSRGVQIATQYVLTERPDAVTTEIENYLAVTRDDVAEAGRWLVKAPRTILEVMPKGRAG